MSVSTPAADPRAASGMRARRRVRATEPVPYDFRRPIQLSREHARILQLSLDDFARQASNVFTSSLRTVSQVSVVSVEQRSYAEYIGSLDATTYMLLINSDAVLGACVLEMPIGGAMEVIDHMLGGPGGPNQPERPLTEIESVVMRLFVDRLLAELGASLTDLVPLDPRVAAVEYQPAFAQVAAPSDVMVVSTFELRVEDSERHFTLCLPFAGLLPHLVRAAAPSPVSDRERAQRAAASSLLHEQFQQVPVDVTVAFRGTGVGPEQVAHLQVGDVLRLSHPAEAPLDVTVGDTVFAHATPGAHGRRLAALIVAAPSEGHPR